VLLNDLAALEQESVLVLDDYHLITTPAIHAALVFLIDHLPPQLHLILASREDPPLPLARLRARGQLAELRARDLRFQLDETAVFLRDSMGVAVTDAAVTTLNARTEGWVAGLQLAALALRDRADPADFVTALSVNQRYLGEYLTGEVLDRLPAHIKTFVLQTSILERMCGELCDAVLGLTTDRPPPTTEDSGWKTQDSNVSGDMRSAIRDPRPSDTPPVVGPFGGVYTERSRSAQGRRRSSVVGDSYSQLILSDLKRRQLLIVSLDDDRRWYRYHQLFADLLRVRLRQGVSADAVAVLHRRASAWYEAQGLMSDAIQHALAAQDWEWAARLIEEYGLQPLLSGQVQTVLGWLNAFPAAFTPLRPLLCVIYAGGLMLSNQFEAAEERLHDAERALQPNTPDDLARVVRGGVALLRGSIIYCAGDLAQAISLIQEALVLLPETTTNAAARMMNAIARSVATARAATAYKLTGDVTAASEQRTADSIAEARAAGTLTATLNSYTYLASLQVLQGRLRAAAATYAEIERLVPGQDALQALSSSPAYYIGMGDLWREWNDLEAAMDYLVRGIELIQQGLENDADVIMPGYIALARVQQARGDGAAALATLDAFMRLARERKFFPLLIEQAAALRARLQLLQGDLPAAIRWAEASGLSPDDAISFPRQAGSLTLARVRMAAGQAETVMPLLHRLLDDAQAKARLHSVIEVRVLQALAYATLADPDRALTTLEQSLTLAEPEGYIRSFVDEGAPMATLLQAARVRGIAPGYVARLLDGYHAV
jgi:LuxR family maltose regulon positive regulatory protein